jgi:L-ribulose-5-phosphate 4-epimerase
MKCRSLREQVCEANKEIARTGLAIFTWGNASGMDRDEGIVAIKPSGVDYDVLKPDDIVLLALDTGETVEGALRPSSDTPTHLHLYRTFPELGGVVHTHSHYATAWAQACREIPCLGTTHADQFNGPVPVTRMLTGLEVAGEYELNTGRVIVECLHAVMAEPLEMRAVLVAGHGPFTWGPDAAKAVESANVLEAVARMAADTLSLRAGQEPIPDYLLQRHYLRKHGKDAYYGQ